MEKISKLNLDLENLLKNRLSHRDTSEVSLDLTDNWWHINKSLLSGTNLLHSPSQHEEISEFTQFVQSVLKKSVGNGDQTHLKDISSKLCEYAHSCCCKLLYGKHYYQPAILFQKNIWPNLKCYSAQKDGYTNQKTFLNFLTKRALTKVK